MADLEVLGSSVLALRALYPIRPYDTVLCQGRLLEAISYPWLIEDGARINVRVAGDPRTMIEVDAAKCKVVTQPQPGSQYVHLPEDADWLKGKPLTWPKFLRMCERNGITPPARKEGIYSVARFSGIFGLWSIKADNSDVLLAMRTLSAVISGKEDE